MASILFISLMNTSSWRSSEELWYKTALHASSTGHQVACCFYPWPQNTNKSIELEKAGCQVFLLPNKGRMKRNLFEKIQYKISSKRVRKYMDNLPLNNYDHILINIDTVTVLSETLAGWNSRLTNYKLMFQNYQPDEILKHNDITPIKSWINNAALNLFITDSICNNLEDKLNVHIDGKIILNPINFDVPDNPTPFIKQPQYVFSMFAAMDIEIKAQDKLIKAFACPKWLQRNFILNLYGEGKDRDRIENLIARKGLTNKIFIKDYPENTREAIEASHLIIRITHNDGMPVSILEAMAISRPLIVSNVGEMPKWVKNNINGWVTRNASEFEIETALEMAWNERTRWEHMGRKSFEIFRKIYPSSVEEHLLNTAGIQKENNKAVIKKMAKV